MPLLPTDSHALLGHSRRPGSAACVTLCIREFTRLWRRSEADHYRWRVGWSDVCLLALRFRDLAEVLRISDYGVWHLHIPSIFYITRARKDLRQRDCSESGVRSNCRPIAAAALPPKQEFSGVFYGWRLACTDPRDKSFYNSTAFNVDAM